MIKRVVVLHHEDNDGNCAGWIVKHYHNLVVPDAEVHLFPVQYSRPLPPNAIALMDKETVLYIVDFSYSKRLLLELQNRVAEIHVFDHHATAEDELKDLPFAIFSKNKAGAGMTWDILMNQRGASLPERIRKVPLFVELVDDYDLWKFKNPDTKAFHAHSVLHNSKDPEFWETFLDNDAKLREFIDVGHKALYFEAQEINNILRSKRIKYGSYQGEDKKYNIAVYQTTHNLSKVGNEILSRNPHIDFTICWFIVPDENQIIFSLRSLGDRTVDVGKDICLSLGGGGHKSAAGFVMGIPEGLSFVSKLYS